MLQKMSDEDFFHCFFSCLSHTLHYFVLSTVLLTPCLLSSAFAAVIRLKHRTVHTFYTLNVNNASIYPSFIDTAYPLRGMGKLEQIPSVWIIHILNVLMITFYSFTPTACFRTLPSCISTFILYATLPTPTFILPYPYLYFQYYIFLIWVSSYFTFSLTGSGSLFTACHT